MKITPETLADVVRQMEEDDSLNPRIVPTEAKTEAYDRWQKAKETAFKLEVEGYLSCGMTEESRQNGEVMSIKWQSTDKEIDVTELIDFLSCFDHIGIDQEWWHCTCHVYR